ncbi:MAG TPA: hypothetical protein VEL76_25785 [Gemmataceae bacterium]|nr:hypothetical protein [Gemmataceae bacterium]
MRTQLSWALAGVVLLSWWAALPMQAGAQVFTNDHIDRGLRTGVWAPYDGMPYTQRYGYNTGAFLYFNGSNRQLYYLDYLDRLDRAEKFGYRRPAGPYDYPPGYPPHRGPCCDPPVVIYPNGR